jgi:hypothetical protein
MHRVHNMYLKSLNDKQMCEKYISDLITCYSKEYTSEKEQFILSKMNIYCYSSLSNKAICSSVNSCGVTLK